MNYRKKQHKSKHKQKPNKTKHNTDLSCRPALSVLTACAFAPAAEVTFCKACCSFRCCQLEIVRWWIWKCDVVPWQNSVGRCRRPSGRLLCLPRPFSSFRCSSMRVECPFKQNKQQMNMTEMRERRREWRDEVKKVRTNKENCVLWRKLWTKRQSKSTANRNTTRQNQPQPTKNNEQNHKQNKQNRRLTSIQPLTISLLSSSTCTCAVLPTNEKQFDAGKLSCCETDIVGVFIFDWSNTQRKTKDKWQNQPAIGVWRQRFVCPSKCPSENPRWATLKRLQHNSKFKWNERYCGRANIENKAKYEQPDSNKWCTLRPTKPKQKQHRNKQKAQNREEQRTTENRKKQ